MNYLTTIKNIFNNKEKRTENLIFLLILLVVLLICINYIFKSDDKNSNNTSSTSNINSSEQSDLENEVESVKKSLEDILSKINGIDDVSVMLTYSSSGKQNLAYNTKEESLDGNKTSEKSVAYNEQSGNKTAIVESTETPKVEGIIIVARGANNVEIKSKIATAAAMVVNVPVYKVQVFEK